MMPPNRFNARFSFASVTVFDGVGPVAAATNGTCGAAKAAVAGCRGPFECGAARAVGVVSSVEALANSIAATVEAVALPENRTSRTSMVCVPEPPLSPIQLGVPGVPIAEPAALAVQVTAADVNAHLAIRISFLSDDRSM